MANGKTYGLTFPFVDSFDGKYLDLTDFPAEEVRSNLIHLLLTRKGSRYFLPDFGTRLLEYIFEPLDRKKNILYCKRLCGDPSGTYKLYQNILSRTN